MTIRTVARDPFIDVVRVAAVWVVVVGHWTVTSVYWDDDGTRIVNALSVVPWVRGSTWITQVMPLLFFAGGFANAVVADRHPGDYGGYLRERMTRLVTPLVALFAVWGSIGLASAYLELPRGDALEHAAFVAAIPLWFLGIYLIVVALAPLMLRADATFGILVPGALLVGAAAVDIAIHGGGMTGLAPLNYAFVWLLAHQLGILYRTGGITRRWAPAAMAGVGLIAMIVLTSLGGYPVSMVGVPGEARWNTDPPSLAIVALTLWLVGLVLALRPVIARWGTRRRRTVQRVHRRLLTVYLWHVPAMSAAVFVLYPAFPQPETGTAEWWRWRPAWLLSVAVAMAVLAWAVGRFEARARPVPDTVTPVAAVGAVLGVVTVAVAVLGVAVTGFSDPLGGGRALLDFRLNAMSNLLHFTVGATLLVGTLRRVRWGSIAATIAAFGFLGAGVLALRAPDALSFLAWNQATAVFHTILGTAAIAALGTVYAMRNAR